MEKDRRKTSINWYKSSFFEQSRIWWIWILWQFFDEDITENVKLANIEYLGQGELGDLLKTQRIETVPTEMKMKWNEQKIARRLSGQRRLMVKLGDVQETAFSGLPPFPNGSTSNIFLSQQFYNFRKKYWSFQWLAAIQVLLIQCY